LPEVQQSPGLLLDEDEFRIYGAMLDHGIPCLAFALTEKLRVNVWREGLRQLELPVGPWLREAKRAVRQGAPADRQISIRDDLSMPLGVLRQGALRDVSDFWPRAVRGLLLFQVFCQTSPRIELCQSLSYRRTRPRQMSDKSYGHIAQGLARWRFHSRHARHSVSECYYIFRNLVAPRSPAIQPRLVAVLERNGQCLGE
jgi:hypothetical protein